MADSVFKKLIIVEADTSSLQKLSIDVTKAQAILNKFGTGEVAVSASIKNSASTMDSFGKVATKTTAEIGTQSGKTFTVLTQGAKASGMATNDLINVMKRAALVAPLWMLVRSAMQLVTSTIQEGIKNWVDFDAALMKSKAVVHGFTGDSSTAIEILRQNIVEFSKESGIAVEKLAAAFYRFGTVGVVFEDAMAGAFASARLAKATMGDTDTIARALAMTYNLLGDTMDATLSPADKMNQIAGITYKLWQKNAFEANEFAAALQGFVGTANILNFTIPQTEVLLASLGTAGVIGAKGGTLLKTAMFQLAQNLDKLAPALGIAAGEGETMYEVLRRVIDSLAEMGQTGKASPEVLKIISELFGGVRGGQVIASFIAVNKQLKENDEVVKNSSESAKELAERYKEVVDSLSGSTERIANFKKLIGEAFVKAIAGGDSFEQSLKNIANTMETGVIPWVQTLVWTLNQVGTAIAPVQAWTNRTNQVSDIMKQIGTMQTGIGAIAQKITFEDLSPQQITELQNNLQSIVQAIVTKMGTAEIDYGIKFDEKGVLAQAHALMLLLAQKEKGNKLSEEDIKKQNELAKINEDKLIYSQKLFDLQKDLTGNKDELKYLQMAKEGTEEITIATEKAKDSLQKFIEMYNALKTKEGTVSPINGEMLTNLLQNATNGGQEETKMLTDYLAPGIRDLSKSPEFKIISDAFKELGKAQIENNATILPQEREKLDIESKLNIQKALGNLTTLQLIDYNKQLVEHSESAYRGKEKELELLKLEKEYVAEIAKLTGKYAKEFKDTFQSSLKDALQSGDVDTALGALKTKLQDMYFGAISTNITNTITKTGLFESIGGIFAGIEDPVAKAHYDGILKGIPYIVQAHVDGMQRAMALSTPGGFTGGGGSIGSGYQMVQGANGVMQAVPSGVGGFTPSSGMVNTGYQNMGGQGFTSAYSPTFDSMGRASGQQAAGGLPSWFPFNQKLNAMSQGGQKSGSGQGTNTGMNAMGLIGGLAGAYGAYQSAGGGAAGAMAGVGGVMMMIPALAPLGAALMIGSMFMGKKKQSSTQSSWQPQAIENMPLNVITGGAPLPEKYALPSSAYFAGKQGRQRGNTNITISIGNINGDGEDVANKIASKVADIYNRESSRGLVNTYPQ